MSNQFKSQYRTIKLHGRYVSTHTSPTGTERVIGRDGQLGPELLRYILYYTRYSRFTRAEAEKHIDLHSNGGGLSDET